MQRHDISLLEFKQFCHGVWSKEHNFVTIDLARWKVWPEFQSVLFSNWYYIKPLLYSYIVSHHGSVSRLVHCSRIIIIQRSAVYGNYRRVVCAT